MPIKHIKKWLKSLEMILWYISSDLQSFHNAQGRNRKINEFKILCSPSRNSVVHGGKTLTVETEQEGKSFNWSFPLYFSWSHKILVFVKMSHSHIFYLCKEPHETFCSRLSGTGQDRDGGLETWDRDKIASDAESEKTNMNSFLCFRMFLTTILIEISRRIKYMRPRFSYDY